MERRVFHYIYKTTCRITGNFYIGKHTTHTINNNYLGSGIILKRSIEKYGKENHIKEILEYLPTLELLNIKESEIVNNILLQNKQCMNLILGGSGSWFGISKMCSERGTLFTLGMLNKKHSEKSKLLMSLSKTGINNNQYGKRIYIDIESNSRILASDRPRGCLTPLEILESKKNKKNSAYGKKWFNNGEKSFLLTIDDGNKRKLKVGRLNPGFKTA